MRKPPALHNAPSDRRQIHWSEPGPRTPHVLTHMCLGEREVGLPCHNGWVAGAFYAPRGATRCRPRSTVFRVAGLDGLQRFLEGRALDRALDPAAASAAAATSSAASALIVHDRLPLSMLPLSMRVGTTLTLWPNADDQCASSCNGGQPLQCFLELGIDGHSSHIGGKGDQSRNSEHASRAANASGP